MDPPAYTSSTPRRTISVLREQILANGSILRPTWGGRSSEENLEVVVAKTGSSLKIPAGTSYNEKRRITTELSSSTAGKHYALLLLRTLSKEKIRILIKEDPRDSVEKALENVLERTEVTLHEVVVRYEKEAEDSECCVM